MMQAIILHFIALFVFPLEWILILCESKVKEKCGRKRRELKKICTAIFSPEILQSNVIYPCFEVRTKYTNWLNYSRQSNGLLFNNCFSYEKIKMFLNIKKLNKSESKENMHIERKAYTIFRKSSRGYYYIVIQFVASIICDTQSPHCFHKNNTSITSQRIIWLKKKKSVAPYTV